MATIFMAEDDPLMGRMYERVFRAGGYTLELAFDGEEAISKLQEMETPPSVMLLDVMMPKKNGFDVLREVKQNEKLKDMPVVMLTNLAGQADIDKALGLGAALYLIKSQYDPQQVFDKVKEIISSSEESGNIPKTKIGV